MNSMSPARMAFDHRPGPDSATSGTDSFVLGMAISLQKLSRTRLAWSQILSGGASARGQLQIARYGFRVKHLQNHFDLTLAVLRIVKSNFMARPLLAILVKACSD